MKSFSFITISLKQYWNICKTIPNILKNFHADYNDL